MQGFFTFADCLILNHMQQSFRKLMLIALLCFANASLFAQYGTQFDNRGFENWTTRDMESCNEPVHWHAGGTATGSFAGLLSSQIEQSSQVRPGSNGSKSVRIYPTKIIGITANGNMTNGRMNAGSMSSTGTENYHYTQRSNSTFNTEISTIPDSVAVWVCFRSESSSQNASIHAAVHGDYDYKFYANGSEGIYEHLVATAKKSFTRTAADNGEMVWRRISVPFVHDGICTNIKYILLTIATNELAGQGSDKDDMFIDDILLIYNPSLRIEQLNKTSFKPLDEITIHFALSGTMSADNLNAEANKVIAQLSDANGSFANPSELGRVTTNESGTITAQIPQVADGHYKVRVISTNYPMIGENITDINISASASVSKNTFDCIVYPNPVNTNIHFSVENHIDKIKIFDINGKVFVEKTMTKNETEIDMTALESGLYFMEIFSGNNKSIQRIVKM